MKLQMAHYLPRWKPFGLWLLLVVVPLTATVAIAEPAGPDALRQQAVSEYIDGATRELDAYRQKIGAVARPGNEQQVSEAKANFDECDRLLTDLKSADPEHFDLIKAAYENARAEMVKAIQAAQSA
jgi:hypothetical protein